MSLFRPIFGGSFLRAIACLACVGLGLGGCANSKGRDSQHFGAKTLNIARSAIAGGNPKLALNVANAVLKSDPTDISARVARADALYLLSDCKQATADYRTVLRAKPNNIDAELGLGRCALQSNPRAAAVAFERAAHDHPTDAAAFNDLGIAEAEQSEFARAKTSFRSALSIDPSLRAAKVNLGMTLALSDDPQQAETILGPLARGPDTTPKIRADYAAALVLSGNSTAAETVLRKDVPQVEAESMAEQLARLGARRSGDATASSKAD